jgi:hypothetical protein
VPASNFFRTLLVSCNRDASQQATVLQQCYVETASTLLVATADQLLARPTTALLLTCRCVVAVAAGRALPKLKPLLQADWLLAVLLSKLLLAAGDESAADLASA